MYTKSINQLCDEFKISPSIAKGILLKHQWNSEKVKSAFLEDKERLLKETLNLNLDEAAKL